jgi:hypothetical protein
MTTDFVHGCLAVFAAIINVCAALDLCGKTAKATQKKTKKKNKKKK